MTKAPLKKRNHTVPRCLLKNWVSVRGGESGISYFDIERQQKFFERGKNARFAIFDYLYVPYREDGRRDDSLEDWFSKDENGLALVAKAAHDGELGKLTKMKYINQAARACIALGYRSPYQMYKFIEKCEEDEDSYESV